MNASVPRPAVMTSAPGEDSVIKDVTKSLKRVNEKLKTLEAQQKRLRTVTTRENKRPKPEPMDFDTDDGDKIVSVKGDSIIVKSRSGETTFKQKVLRKMLVDKWKFTAKQAAAACLGFGLDPRPHPHQRHKSCTCGNDIKDSSHKFPTGFSFTVREEYKNFQ